MRRLRSVSVSNMCAGRFPFAAAKQQLAYQPIHRLAGCGIADAEKVATSLMVCWSPESTSLSSFNWATVILFFKISLNRSLSRMSCSADAKIWLLPRNSLPVRFCYSRPWVPPPLARSACQPPPTARGYCLIMADINPRMMLLSRIEPVEIILRLDKRLDRQCAAGTQKITDFIRSCVKYLHDQRGLKCSAWLP